MSWSPNLKNVVQPLATDKLLKKAVLMLYRKDVISQPKEVLRDEHGVWGYRYGQFIMVAKKELHGYVVSCHEEAVLKAMMHKVGIVMYLDSRGIFYSFDPYKIQEVGEKNYKGLASMINFSIKLGKAVEW